MTWSPKVVNDVAQLLVMIVAAMLLWSTYTDVRTRLVPDTASIVIALTALIGFLYRYTGASDIAWLPTLETLIIGPVLGVGLLLLTEALLDRIHVDSPIQDVIGGGDLKLVGALGMWLGSQILIVLLVASIAAVLVAAVFSPRSMVDAGERFTESRVAYVPFLALGFVPAFLGIVQVW